MKLYRVIVQCYLSGQDVVEFASNLPNCSHVRTILRSETLFMAETDAHAIEATKLLEGFDGFENENFVLSCGNLVDGEFKDARQVYKSGE